MADLRQSGDPVYTLRERLGSIDGLSIWIVGDVLPERVMSIPARKTLQLGRLPRSAGIHVMTETGALALDHRFGPLSLPREGSGRLAAGRRACRWRPG
jgi:hypothetical protein